MRAVASAQAYVRSVSEDQRSGQQLHVMHLHRTAGSIMRTPLQADEITQHRGTFTLKEEHRFPN